MSIEALKAAQAYAKASMPGEGGGVESAGKSAPSFADMIKDAVVDTREALATSESQSISAIKGEAELVDVVSAIAAAEVTLETVVTVRDRVINAYQEIMRLPM